jgi:hypothetical protein
MKLAILALVVLNVALAAAWGGLFGRVASDAPRRGATVAAGRRRAAARWWARRPPPARPWRGHGGGCGQGRPRCRRDGCRSTGAAPALADRRPGRRPARHRWPRRRPVAGPATGGAALAQAESDGTARACVEWGAFTEAELPRAQAALWPGRARRGARAAAPRERTAQLHRPPVAAAGPADRAGRAPPSCAPPDSNVYVLRDGPLRHAVSLGLFRQE